MFIICQDVEILVKHWSFQSRVLISCTVLIAILTVFVIQSWRWQLVPVNWLLVLDSKVALVPNGSEVEEVPGSF